MSNRMVVTTRTYSQYDTNVQLGSSDPFKNMVLPCFCKVQHEYSNTPKSTCNIWKMRKFMAIHLSYWPLQVPPIWAKIDNCCWYYMLMVCETCWTPNIFALPIASFSLYFLAVNSSTVNSRRFEKDLLGHVKHGFWKSWCPTDSPIAFRIDISVFCLRIVLLYPNCITTLLIPNLGVKL